MKHLNIRWNPELREWFCVKCGKTSDQVVPIDALVEMEQFERDLLTTQHANQTSPPGQPDK